MQKSKILFLAANPQSDPLQLEEECRAIRKKICAAKYGDSLELITRWAVRPDDLQQLLLEEKPDILHFSGHGTPEEAIVLVNDQGHAQPVSKQALWGLLSVLTDNIQVVVFNACYSRPQADAITEFIDCAVGMNQAIGDKAAVVFASAFYQALGFGRSVREAFELGKNALELVGIPEETTPELVVKSGVDPSRITLIHAPSAPMPRSEAQNVPAWEGTRERPSAFRVFISYAREDTKLCEKLRTQLTILKRRGMISLWHDREITPGEDWKDQINDNINTADIILLLISSSFLASDYCYDVEMKRALERHHDGTARVIPIILRESEWKIAEFSRLQALPTGGEPVTGRHWRTTDEALADVASGIRRVVEELRSRH